MEYMWNWFSERMAGALAGDFLFCVFAVPPEYASLNADRELIQSCGECLRLVGSG
jgi:hypothetical protein